jgi:hypothetical protein
MVVLDSMAFDECELTQIMGNMTELRMWDCSVQLNGSKQLCYFVQSPILTFSLFYIVTTPDFYVNFEMRADSYQGFLTN